MQCPNCKTHSLLNADLEYNLPCLRCTGCGGVLVSVPAYSDWLDGGAPLAAEAHTPRLSNPSLSDEPDWRCPMCQDAMETLTALVGNGSVPHACTSCELVWMTGPEWLRLRTKSPKDPIAEEIARLGRRSPADR